MGLKSHSRQGCKGFSSFSAVFSTAEKSRANSEPGAARPGAQIKRKNLNSIEMFCLFLLNGRGVRTFFIFLNMQKEWNEEDCLFMAFQYALILKQ